MQFQNLWFLDTWMLIPPVVIMNSFHLIVDDLLESCPNLIEMIELLNELRKYEFGDLKFREFKDVNSNAVLQTHLIWRCVSNVQSSVADLRKLAPSPIFFPCPRLLLRIAYN